MKDPYGYRPYRGSRVRRRGIIINTLLAVAIIAAAVWVLCLLLPLEEGGLRFPGQGEPAADGTAVPDTSDAGAAASSDTDKPAVSETEPTEPSEPAKTTDSETASDQAEPSYAAGQLSSMKNQAKAQPLFPERPEGPQNNRMVLLSARDFIEQADLLLSLYQSGEVTGAAIIMKDERGVLYYPSDIEWVLDEPGIRKPADGIEQAVSRLKQAGVPLTAVMYTHQDDLFPRMKEARALQNIEHVGWRDQNSRVYIDPANEEATEYLATVAKELHELGFGEILLRGIGYPSQGWLARIAYADDRFGTVTGLVAAVQTAAPSAQVSVWLDTPEMAMNGDTGQSVSALYDAASRIFAELPPEEEGGAAALQSALNAAAGSTGKLITVISSLSDSEGLPAVLMDIPLNDLQQ